MGNHECVQVQVSKTGKNLREVADPDRPQQNFQTSGWNET